MKRPRFKNKDGTASELEAALVGRLRNLAWPKPTTEVKQRCLDDILSRMADIRSEASSDGAEPAPVEEAEVEQAEVDHGGHGLGDSHSSTRSAAGIIHRQPWHVPARSTRLATVLW